jgi:tetratricopeptide (TPR) repeat protein
MTLDRDLEQKLRKLGEEVAPGHSLKDGIQAQLAKEPEPQIQPVTPWRTMMKSPIMKMTPAAAAIVVVAICIALWQGPSTPAYAIGQTVEAMRNIRFVHVVQRSGIGGVIEQERWIELDTDGRQVRYRHDKPPHVFVINDGDSAARFHPARKAMVLYDQDEMAYQWIGSLGETFDNLLKEGLIIEEDSFRQGRCVHKVWWPSMRCVCYVDPETKLPIAIGATELSYEEPGAGTFDISRYAYGYTVTDHRQGTDAVMESRENEADQREVLYADLEIVQHVQASVETVGRDNVIRLYQTGPHTCEGEVDLKITSDSDVSWWLSIRGTGAVPAKFSCWVREFDLLAPGGVATVGVELVAPGDVPRAGHAATVMLKLVPRPDSTRDARACETLGLALYDARRYEEALGAFERMAAATNANEDDRAIAVTWQGHMLDLLGRRDEAIARYQEVAGLGLESSMRFDRYGLSYAVTPYAKERIKTPFIRIENRDQY